MKRNNNTYEPPKHPDLVHVLKAALDDLRLKIRVATPAKVIKYDATQQLADVEIQFLPILYQQEKPGPIITAANVPVIFPRTHTGYLTFPVQIGDTGLLVVNDRALDKWLELGVPVDPQFPATHQLHDGVFFPGLHAKSDPITPATSLTSTVLEGPTIQLGRTAVKGVARLGDTVTAGVSMATWLSAATAKLNALPGPPLVGPLDFGVIDQASEKVLSE
jgi:hypothetical protein